VLVPRLKQHWFVTRPAGYDTVAYCVKIPYRTIRASLFTVESQIIHFYIQLVAHRVSFALAGQTRTQTADLKKWTEERRKATRETDAMGGGVNNENRLDHVIGRVTF